MKIKIDVPNGEECLGCQSLIPPTYYTNEYVCDAFHMPLECYYDLNTNKGYYERHIYKCKQCLNEEVKEQ